MQANPNPIINLVPNRKINERNTFKQLHSWMSDCTLELKNMAKKRALHMRTCKYLPEQINVDLSFGRFAHKHSWYWTHMITGFDEKDCGVRCGHCVPHLVLLGISVRGLCCPGKTVAPYVGIMSPTLLLLPVLDCSTSPMLIFSVFSCLP